MNIILNIGLFFGAITLVVYLIVFAMVLFEFAAAYVNGRLPIRPQVVNWIFRNQFYMFSSDRQKYEEAGQDPSQALTGEYAAVIGVGGFMLTAVVVPLWPFMLILLALKAMREYNTNKQFHEFVDSLFERDGLAKKENSLKGIDGL